MKYLDGTIKYGINDLQFELKYSLDCMIELYDNKLDIQFLRSDHVNDSLLKDGGLSTIGGYPQLSRGYRIYKDFFGNLMGK